LSLTIEARLAGFLFVRLPCFQAKPQRTAAHRRTATQKGVFYAAISPWSRAKPFQNNKSRRSTGFQHRYWVFRRSTRQRKGLWDRLL